MFLTRHQDLIKDIDLNTEIIVAGAGSIGSYTVLALTKLGFENIRVYDDGIIEEENIAPQFYKVSDVGLPKVVALSKSIKGLTGTSITGIQARLTSDDVAILNKRNTILILTVDSMKARKDLSNIFYGKRIIDARMAISFLTIVSSASIVNSLYHSETLFDDSEAVQESCTNKASAYTSLLAGGLISNLVLQFLKNEDHSPDTTISFDINSFDLVKV